MITKLDVDRLRSYTVKPDSPVLSVYLTVERSQMADRQHHLKTVLKQLIRSIEEQLSDSERLSFQEDAEHVLQFFDAYTLQGQSVVLFCDHSASFFWERSLHIPLCNLARWDTMVYVRPLLEAMDEYERFGIVLTDKTRARFFMVFLGEIEEEFEAFAPAEVKHVKTTGTDHIWSQKRIQRKAEVHARWHLKQVAEELDRLVDYYALDHLILAGPTEATTELSRLLPKRLRSRLAGTISLSIEVTAHEVLQEALKIEQTIERSREIELIEDLLTAVAKNDRAGQGLEETLQAIQEGRIWRLVYAQGFSARGAECERCSALFAEKQENCAYCGAPLHPIEDLLESMIQRVLDQGGKVEEVHEVAAQNLLQAGGIGAFLRF